MFLSVLLLHLLLYERFLCSIRLFAAVVVFFLSSLASFFYSSFFRVLFLQNTRIKQPYNIQQHWYETRNIKNEIAPRQTSKTYWNFGNYMKISWERVYVAVFCIFAKLVLAVAIIDSAMALSSRIFFWYCCLIGA